MKKVSVKSLFIYGLIFLFCITAAVEFIRSRSDTAAKNGQESNALVTPGGANGASDKSLSAGKLPEHVRAVMARSVKEPEPNPTVGIGRGTNYGEVTETAIANAGGLEGIIKKGDVVLIKPNLCTEAKPDSPTTTDYRVVQKIAELARNYGASKIIIAEGGFTGQAFNETTFKSNLYDTIEGVEFFNINDCDKEDCYEVMPEKSLINKALLIPKVYMDADVVITAAKLKTHYLSNAVVTLSLKNSFGAVSSKLYGTIDKGGLHNFGLSQAIVELNKIRKPDFAVIDGIVGGEGYGPSNNTPVKSNIIFAGRDPAALDTVTLTFMGFKVADIPYVKLAGEEKVGITDLAAINVVGAKLDEIKMAFKR